MAFALRNAARQLTRSAPRRGFTSAVPGIPDTPALAKYLAEEQALAHHAARMFLFL